MKYEAVTFDYWNTLLPETHEAFEARVLFWGEILDNHGHAFTHDQVRDAFKHSWTVFEAKWKANEQSDAADCSADAWTHLGITPEPSLADELVEAYWKAADYVPRELLPNVEETVDRLRGLGLRVGIICDVGSTPSTQLRSWLDELGILFMFHHFSFSDEVGVYKPDPVIFHHALEGLGVSDPSRAAHVGDIRRTDIAGARGVGMTGIRYKGHRDDPEEGDEADHVIDDHLMVLDVLGLR